MNGSRAKLLRRVVYGDRSCWTLDGYFPLHPAHRTHTVMKTYQKIVPKLTRADLDEDKSTSIQIAGADGHTYNYRYVPWEYHGVIAADIERRKYQWAKRNWKRLGIVDTHRGW